MRKIIIYSVNNYTIPKNIKQSLADRNTNIQYIPVKNSTEELIELYGYDTTLKYSSRNISSRAKFINVLKTIIKKIDKMPMGTIEKTIRNKMNKMNKMNGGSYTRKRSLAKCGLPDIAETQHCFSDTTHHTCCMLGQKAREYADSSGNPIGTLSVKVNDKVRAMGKSKSKSKSNNTKKGLVPWCTCTGSKVCSYYTNKFGKEDGTHIKFIGTGKTKNEDKAISEIGLMKHRTPGVM
jgi:hypothetical protein